MEDQVAARVRHDQLHRHGEGQRSAPGRRPPGRVPQPVAHRPAAADPERRPPEPEEPRRPPRPALAAPSARPPPGRPPAPTSAAAGHGAAAHPPACVPPPHRAGTPRPSPVRRPPATRRRCPAPAPPAGPRSGQRPARAYDGSGSAPSQPQNTAPPTATRTRSDGRARNAPHRRPVHGSAPRAEPGVLARSGAGRAQLRGVAAPSTPRRARGPHAPAHTDHPHRPLRTPHQPCRPTRRTWPPAAARSACRCIRARSTPAAARRHMRRTASMVTSALVRGTITWHRSWSSRRVTRTPRSCAPTHTTRTAGSRHDRRHTAPRPPPRSPCGARPRADRRDARLTRFQAWAAERHGAPRRSPATPSRPTPRCTAGRSSEPRGFWQAVTEWFDVRFSTPHETRARRRARCPAPAGSPAPPSTTPSTLCAPPSTRAGRTSRRCCTSTRATSPAPSAGPNCSRQVGSLAAAAAPPRRHAPATGSAATCPTSPQAVVAVARHGRRRRRVDLLRPRLRRPQRPGPLPAGRTGRAVHRRRLPLRRQGARPRRDSSPNCAP